MKQGDVILGLLTPADENPAKPIQPTMRPLHHPTTRLLPGGPLQRLRLLAPRPDVRREPERRHELTHFVVVIPLVHAQPLGLGGRVFAKPADLAAARAQLRALRGRTHTLHSAIALASDGKVVFAHCERAALTMRNFSDGFLEAYIETAGPAVLASVGCYQVEAAGIQLFERIEGDHFTILGLPLLPLLAYLRGAGYLAE